MLNRNVQRESASAVSDAAEDHGSNIMFESENKVVGDVQTSLGDWSNAQMDQQVKSENFTILVFILSMKI